MNLMMGQRWTLTSYNMIIIGFLLKHEAILRKKKIPIIWAGLAVLENFLQNILMIFVLRENIDLYFHL